MEDMLQYTEVEEKEWEQVKVWMIDDKASTASCVAAVAFVVPVVVDVTVIVASAVDVRTKGSEMEKIE